MDIIRVINFWQARTQLDMQNIYKLTLKKKKGGVGGLGVVVPALLQCAKSAD